MTQSNKLKQSEEESIPKVSPINSVPEGFR